MALAVTRFPPSLAAGLLSLALLAQPSEVTEARVRLALIEKLVRFVDWPGEAPPPDRPFVLAVVGRTPFGDELDEYFRRRTIKNRPVRIRYLKTLEDLGECDLLYVCASEKDRIPALLALVRHRPILTLGETPGFTRAGVMVGLIREGDRIGFELNLTRAKEAGFRFSPGFIQLAKVQG